MKGVLAWWMSGCSGSITTRTEVYAQWGHCVDLSGLTTTRTVIFAWQSHCSSSSHLKEEKSLCPINSVFSWLMATEIGAFAQWSHYSGLFDFHPIFKKNCLKIILRNKIYLWSKLGTLSGGCLNQKLISNNTSQEKEIVGEVVDKWLIE